MKGIGVCVAVFTASVSLAADYVTPKPGEPLRSAVLDALRPAVEREIEQKVLFKVDQLRVSARFAFVTAQPLSSSQEPIDYSKTKFANSVREGLFDDWLCALLEKTNGQWRVLACEIGATDVPFVPWPDEFGVPKEIIFGEP